ncbi:MAG: cyclic-di-AMP receptor [Clostridia bacterium]|nr:cyclic-di-AMP receptor [Clostridia bacterium]
MKLILSIINSEDTSNVLNALNEQHFQVTKLSTTGGFLRKGNTTFITGVADEKVDEVIKIIEKTSNKRTQLLPNTSSLDMGVYSALPFEVTVGGATIFVLDVDKFEKI